MKPDSELIYQHGNYCAPEHERGVRFDAPRAGIERPLEPTDLSEEDRSWPWLIEEFTDS